MEIWIIFYVYVLIFIYFYLDMGKWQEKGFVRRDGKGIEG